jgi:hypothetical protein
MTQMICSPRQSGGIWRLQSQRFVKRHVRRVNVRDQQLEFGISG